MKTKIEVEIKNIDVSDYYFSFDYNITINGKFFTKDEYSSNHTWQNDLKNFKLMLEHGEAVKLALEVLFNKKIKKNY